MYITNGTWLVNLLLNKLMKWKAHQELAPKWSPFKSIMIQKMDAILHLHQEHSAKVHGTTENIHTRLENIKTRLSLRNLQDPDEGDP